MRTGKLWAAFRPYLWITLASAVFALGFDWCYVPNQITLGGMTGLGQIIHAIVPAIPVGSAVIALNLPLFLLGWRLLGWKLLASSLFATAATSLGVDLLAACYSFPPMDPMLASVFGGALIGLSLGMVFLQGATTGGTDLIARLLKLRFGHLPMGTLVMAVDLVVIARVIHGRPDYLPLLAKPAAAAGVMGLGAWAVYGLLSKLLSYEEVTQAGETIQTLGKTGNGIAVMGAILIAVIIYAVLVVALRAISREDLSLMPKGDKIAKILRL